jgi:hypothetical protein
LCAPPARGQHLLRAALVDDPGDGHRDMLGGRAQAVGRWDGSVSEQRRHLSDEVFPSQ